MRFDFSSVIGEKVRVCVNEGKSGDDKGGKVYVGVVRCVYSDHVVISREGWSRAVLRHLILRIDSIISMGLYRDAGFFPRGEPEPFRNKTYGLTLRVRSWIYASKRNFATAELVEHLGLTTAKERKKLDKCLNRMIKKGEISRIKRGFYRYEQQG